MNNIEKVYNNATDTEKRDGLLWYPEAFRTCATLAEEFKVVVKNTVWALASLSPNNSWTNNILDLVKVLKCYSDNNHRNICNSYENGDKSAFKSLACRTYPINILKAFHCLDGRLDYLKGKKVTSFADNIWNPASQKVTVDGHAYSIYAGQKMSMSKASPYIKKEYDIVEKAYQDTASKIGIKPMELQAITWVSWRNK